MPALTVLPQYERHLTLAALAHCPRDHYYIDQMRRGLLVEDPPSESLMIGILVHVGLGALWDQRVGVPSTSLMPWLPSLALDMIDLAPEAQLIDAVIVATAKKAVADYAAQWTGARDHWNVLHVESLPPQEWQILDDRFVSYPDLIVEAPPLHPVLVVDHKTSKWKFEAAKWEYSPELLTQCLAARQLTGAKEIFYQADWLQRPGRQSTVWSFPATPVWEFTEAKAALAKEWMDNLTAAVYSMGAVCGDAPWPREISQCQTPWGLCHHYQRCFGGANE